MKMNMAFGLAMGLGLLTGLVVRAQEGGADRAGKEIAGSKSTDSPVRAGDTVLIVPDAPVAIPEVHGLRGAGQNQSNAAECLATLLERATGLKPAIVAAAKAPSSGTRIFVGYGPHLEGKIAPPSAPEGLKIQELDGALYLLGEIAPAGIVNNPGPLDRGVMHAVETFAEQVLGYRFLLSSLDKAEEKNGTFELGTVIPKLDKIAIPKGLMIEDAPVFQHRVTGSQPRRLMGLRAGSAPDFFANHSYVMNWWADRFGKSDPDMFIRNNPAGESQAAQKMEVGAAQPNLGWLDFTNPKVLEVRLRETEKLIKGDRGGGFSYRANQRYVVEEPPDYAAESLQYNERSRALWDPNHHQWGNFSNIWFDYLNRMSPEVKKRWPGMRIATLAYYRHYGLPTFEVADNIDVQVCLMRTSMANKEPEVFQKNLQELKAWSAKLGGDRSRLFLWEYGCWPGMFRSAPVICPNAMQRWLREVRPLVTGVFFEMYEPREYYFLMRRLWMRLLWNPELDVNAEIDDLCRNFFGPAGGTMAEFYKLLAARYEMPWKDPKLTWDQYYLDYDLYYGQSYTPEVVDRLAGLLEKARRESGVAPGFSGTVVSGAAVHVANPDAEPAPLSFSIEALADRLRAPTLVWDGGRYQLRGSLQPGERLDIAADGSAKVVTAAGETRSVEVSKEGEAPVLAAGASQLVRFRKQGGNPKAEFRAVVRQGAGAKAASADESIYARRLVWMSRAYRILPPEGSWSKDVSDEIAKKGTTPLIGFFAHARWYHQSKGLVPSWTEPAGKEFEDPEIAQAKGLIQSAQEALKRAAALAGPEREKETAAAAEAFHEGMRLYPAWEIEDLDEKDPWSVVGARVKRAGLFCGIGEFDKARAEYEEARKATGRSPDAGSYVDMLIGDSYQQQENWIKAEEYYLRAQKTGLYGDRKVEVPAKLEKVKSLAEEQRKAQAEKAEPKP